MVYFVQGLRMKHGEKMAKKYLTSESESFFKALENMNKGNAKTEELAKDLAVALRAIQADFGLGKLSKKGKR